MVKIPMRRKYMIRLIFRAITVAALIALYLLYPDCFSILDGDSFFQQFNPLHLVWLIWMFHMIQQLFPARGNLALGSQKFLRRWYESGDQPNFVAFRAFFKRSNQGALRVFLIWLVLTLLLGGLYRAGVYSASVLLLISSVFYLCDLICVLFWCPFRVFLMKNRCCTTCRIFNWDHLMMFSPLVFIRSFYTLSLFFTSLIVFLVWEFCFFRYPERFWDRTNRALRCTSCTDQLCNKE